MSSIYKNHRMFKVEPGTDGTGVYVKLWDGAPKAAETHGDVFWVRDTLVCCIQVNPEVLNDPRLPRVYPTVHVLRRGA